MEIEENVAIAVLSGDRKHIWVKFWLQNLLFEKVKRIKRI